MVKSSSQSIPRWLSRQLKLADIDVISEAIHRAERLTDGEIVPVIVHSSFVTSHLVALCVVVLWFGGFVLAVALERHHDWLELGIGMFVIAGVGVLLGASDAVLRCLTPDVDLETVVWQRAQAEFVQEGIGRTQRKTGILLFVSMAEHRAVVLADQNIAAKCPPEIWHEVVALIIYGLKHNRFPSGLCAAIERCASIVQPYFPKVEGGANELPNRLVIRE